MSDVDESTKRSNHDLWVGSKVLTISIDRESKAFPPHIEQVVALNETIQLLARAAKAVSFQAENDEQGDSAFHMQPIEGIADAIVLLSQLSEAVTLKVMQA